MKTNKSKIIDSINNSISQTINSVEYLGEPTKKHLAIMNRDISHLETDWENLLREPAPNDSRATKKELRYISRATHGRDDKHTKLVYLVDKEPLDLFFPYLKQQDLKFPHKQFKEAHDKIVDPISLLLKWKHKRPRPAQLADKFNIDINVINTTSHHTPAYPSGHAAYAFLAANMLGDLYPEHYSKFNELASLVGYARVLQGVHYPSDNNAGKILATAIWQDIKHNIFPDLV